MQKTLGCTLVAAGTAIGAGTLALPLVVAGMGFEVATLVFIGIWALMWVSGLLTLEVNLAFQPPRNSYATMAEATLGQTGKWATYVLFILLLYTLTAAYMTGGASLLQAGCTLLLGGSLPLWANAVLYTLCLGAIVACSTRAVDLFNRGLFSVKTVLMVALFVVLLPQIDVSALLSQVDWQYAGVGIPVILTAFGFHIVIPSITQYMGHDVPRLKKVLLFGSLIPLMVYLIWVACMIGTIPYQGEHSLAQIVKSTASVQALMFTLNAIQHSPWMSAAINIFSHVIIATSFLGVSLSLFDFLRDKEHERLPHRGRTALLTFIPPLAVVVFYPNAFIQLLSYASIFVSVILIILPAIMAWRLRILPELRSPYTVPGGRPVLVVVIILGLVLIGTELARMAGFFPTWPG